MVAIPSLDEADSIGHPTRVADQGLRDHFPDLSAAIINVDNHSTDGTREAFLATATTRAAEAYLETVARAFEREKPYLLARWSEAR